MAVITTPVPTLIDRPAPYAGPEARRLTSVFPVIAANARLLYSGVQYEIDTCDATTATTVDFDSYDDCIRTATKVFDEGLDFTESFTPPPLLSAYKCRPGSLGGGTYAEYAERAERQLLRKESLYLEGRVAANVASTGTAVTGFANDSLKLAALLEKEIDNPTLHIGTGYAMILGQGLQNIIDSGITVVVGKGYGGKALLTGSVTIWGGEIETHAVPSLEDNYTMALAERQYVVDLGACETYYTQLGYTTP